MSITACAPTASPEEGSRGAGNAPPLAQQLKAPPARRMKPYPDLFWVASAPCLRRNGSPVHGAAGPEKVNLAGAAHSPGSGSSMPRIRAVTRKASARPVPGSSIGGGRPTPYASKTRAACTATAGGTSGSAMMAASPPEVAKQLRQLAVDEDTSLQKLLGEALDLLFQSRRLPTIASK